MIDLWKKQHYLHELEDVSGERFFVSTVEGNIATYRSRSGDIAVRDKDGCQVRNPDTSSPFLSHFISIDYAAKCKEINKRKFIKSELLGKFIETKDTK